MLIHAGEISNDFLGKINLSIAKVYGKLKKKALNESSK